MAETTPGYDAALAAAEFHRTIRDRRYIAELAGQLTARHPGLLTPQLRPLILRAQLALLIHALTPETPHGH